MSADLERVIVSHYNLPSAYPTSWPTELDDSDDEVDHRSGARRSRSRYSALERAASDRRTMLPGSQRTGDGKTNLVQKDEPNPLGGGGSVIASLRNRGLPVEQDVRLRNKFLLSSTTFSPALFLSQTHSDASTEDLLHGLRFLSQSIDQKAQSLKVLVETNFERFVRAKATIDNVFSEMQNQGVEKRGPPSPTQPSRHSRQTSRLSGIHSRHFSSSSAQMAPAPSAPSKNALRKETEYGVQGIKGPLFEVSQKADDVWGPALGGREREASLKSIVEAVEKDRALYELGGELSTVIRHKNYEKAVELYSSAREYKAQATAMVERAISQGQSLTDEQIGKILVTARMWHNVEEQAKFFRRDIWRRLTDAKSIAPNSMNAQGEEHMELIGVLLELGVDDNPIWLWLLSRYDNLKNKIAAVVDRSKAEIEILRRRLLAIDAPTPEISAVYLRNSIKDDPEQLDSEQVIDFWKTLSTYVAKLISVPNGLLGEIVEFWESAQSFIEGNKQRSLPTGYQGESRKHHRLSEAGVKDLQNGVVTLINLIRDALYALFAEEPLEDISALFSPTSAGAQTPSTPFGTTFSPSEGRIGNISEQVVPVLETKKGTSFEKYAFWPPHCNALSAVHYVGQILVLVGTVSGDMAALGPITNNNVAHEKIKLMVGAARERCLQAVCEAWGNDAEHCKHLENWLRSSEKRNQTRLPTYFNAFEKKVLSGMQKILYLSEATPKAGVREIVSPPSTKLLQLVRTQFVSSIYKALSGMIENAESAPKQDEDEWSVVADSMHDTSTEGSMETASYSVNAKNRNIRMLLMLSNLKVLRHEHVPQLIRMFESSFSVKLTDESKSIMELMGKVEAQLFHTYTKPTVAELTTIIKEGINSASWPPTGPKATHVSPYVYATLMRLVLVHTEVSTTVSDTVPMSVNTNNNTNSTSTGGNGVGGSDPSGNTPTTPLLLTEILSHLLETISQALLDSFKTRKLPSSSNNTYTLLTLSQATLDTEFLAQTMSQYSTKKAGEIQNSIYVELDARSTNEARVGLQRELIEMRTVLKRLREGSRNSFGCFRRVKTSVSSSSAAAAAASYPTTGGTGGEGK